MEDPKEFLEKRLKELVNHRESLRKSVKKSSYRNDDISDTFKRWAKETTLSIRSYKKVIKKLNSKK